MGDTTQQNFELRQRKQSSSPDPGFNGSMPSPDEQEHNKTHNATTSPSPSHPLDLSTFRSLIATNKSAWDILLSPSNSPEEPLFYIKNGSLKRNTPSVSLNHINKDGVVIGTLKLGWGRDNTFGLGDPDKDGTIDWVNMRRTSEWKHSRYEFEYGNKTYVWQRTKQAVFSDQPNLELYGKEDSEVVLAVYKGNQGMMWKSRGQFWLSPILTQDSPIAWEGSNVGSWSQLELLALLSALGIIESSRRRARGRRSGGGAAAGGG